MTVKTLALMTARHIGCERCALRTAHMLDRMFDLVEIDESIFRGALEWLAFPREGDDQSAE